MRAWPCPTLPPVTGDGRPLALHDVARDEVVPVALDGSRPARLYVCGVTPYDTTHLGHAATYVTFDLVLRALRDAGHDVTYVQNVTDVDDPLLERAERDGVDWRELAHDQVDLFREDMAALAVVPPDHLAGVVESMPVIVEAVLALRGRGTTYELVGDDGARDTYLDLSATPGAGSVYHLAREQMLQWSGERGGDPDRAGKRDPLDPLLWRGERAGEPSWDGGVLGPGRPGWHVECTALALHHLGPHVDVQGGGTDLVFPHHEMSVLQAEAITRDPPFAGHTTHQAMVAYDGAKMSKSKGNLVRVSTLRREGVAPAAIRLALLAHHYRTEWEWTAGDLDAAQARLACWREALSLDAGPDTTPVMALVRERVADDLDTPGALAAVDAWCEAACSGPGASGPDRVVGAPSALAALCAALLGVGVTPA